MWRRLGRSSLPRAFQRQAVAASAAATAAAEEYHRHHFTGCEPQKTSGKPSTCERLPSINTQALEKRTGKLALSGRYHTGKLEDDYEVTTMVLGTGCNGAVKLARSKATGQKFAIKPLKLAKLSNKDKEHLYSEVEVFLCMDHPHITRLHDVYDSGDALILVMECMEGGELFDRVAELADEGLAFSERDAADAIRQMLLAINYLHSHGIVHRDLKLENFLYDQPGSTHLKLTDFGFSKMGDPNIKLRSSCGTLSYMAPEVLAARSDKSGTYDSQCDLWSLGVVAFTLLAGYLPFDGPAAEQAMYIREGKYHMSDTWSKISEEATSFATSLLEVDPAKRLNAEQALDHPWLQHQPHRATSSSEVDASVVQALRQFGQASKFRRCCLSMMAWSLSNEERAKVRQYFLAMDTDNSGTISMSELKQILEEKFHVPDEETRAIFRTMDSNNDMEIHYSDFLAAMVSTRIALNDDLLHAAFTKFDTDNSGYITVENLREILGDTFDGQEVEKLILEADLLQDGRVSYPEFVAYLRGDPLVTNDAKSPAAKNAKPSAAK